MREPPENPILILTGAPGSGKTTVARLLAVCASRAASREVGRLTEIAVVEGLWRDFANLGPLKHHAVESDGRGAEEIAEEAAQRLRDGLLGV